MNNNIEKPICLEIEDAKNYIASYINELINNKHIPMFILEPIFADVHRQIKEGKERELVAANQYYEEQLITSSQTDDVKDGD